VSTELLRKAPAEAVGTAVLVAAVIGSGNAAQRLSPHDVGLQLLENSLTTGAAPVALRGLGLADPAGRPIEIVRQVRDDIRGRVQDLIKDVLPTDTSAS
jgi:hypothetical protein